MRITTFALLSLASLVAARGGDDGQVTTATISGTLATVTRGCDTPGDDRCGGLTQTATIQTIIVSSDRGRTCDTPGDDRCASVATSTVVVPSASVSTGTGKADVSVTTITGGDGGATVVTSVVGGSTETGGGTTATVTTGPSTTRSSSSSSGSLNSSSSSSSARSNTPGAAPRATGVPNVALVGLLAAALAL